MRVPYLDLVAKHEGLRGGFVAALDRVLSHGQLVLGPEVQELETRLATQLGVGDVVTCNSGTDALLLALLLREIGPGDEVITVSHSFVATANAIVRAGATPVLVDIDEHTMAIDPDCVRAALGPRTRAIIPVHLNGFPCDIAPLAAICREHGLSLIEDCAQAFGARRQGRSVGREDIGCFSLHPLKTLSAAGDGGFVSVRGAEDAHRLRRLRNHGLADRDTCVHVGINSRLDSLQAAFVLVLLDHIDGWLDRRRANASAYREALDGLVRLPPDDAQVVQTYAAFVVRHADRDRIISFLEQRGVDAKVHYPRAIHQQPAYAGVARGPLPITERVVDQIVSLPVSPELAASDLAQTIRAIEECLAVEAR